MCVASAATFVWDGGVSNFSGQPAGLIFRSYNKQPVNQSPIDNYLKLSGTCQHTGVCACTSLWGWLIQALRRAALRPSLSASCGNETPLAASRSWAIGGREGERLKEEKSIRLGWANTLGDWGRGGRHRASVKGGERETIKEKPPLLPINKPAQHYCRSPQSLSTQGRGIRESSPSKHRQPILHLCSGECTRVCV